MRITSLYSGSSGNCTLVETSKHNILIDVGVSMKKIDEALVKTPNGLELNDIDIVLLTHHHSDHLLSLGAIYNRYPNITFLMNKSVYEGVLHVLKGKTFDTEKRIRFTDERIVGKDLEISDFALNHDVPCYGYTIKDLHTDESVMFVADNGERSYNFSDILQAHTPHTYYVIECDYDEEMLYLSKKRSAPTKRRTLSTSGHTSNRDAIDKAIHFLEWSENTYCKGILFNHLSSETNSPERAKEMHIAYIETWGKEEVIGEIPLHYALKDDIVVLE